MGRAVPKVIPAAVKARIVALLAADDRATVRGISETLAAEGVAVSHSTVAGIARALKLERAAGARPGGVHKKSSKYRAEVLRLAALDPRPTQQEIADKLGISQQAVQYLLSK